MRLLQEYRKRKACVFCKSIGILPLQDRKEDERLLCLQEYKILMEEYSVKRGKNTSSARVEKDRIIRPLA